MIFGHGDNAYQYPQKIIANFSSNVFYKGASLSLINHLKNNLHLIGSYPETIAESLTNNLAKKHLLSTSNFVITNGATEAFYLIALLFSHQKSEIFIPTFAEYEDACKTHQHQMTYTALDKITPDYQCKSNLSWICNPNNPSGRLINKDILHKLIQNNPQTTFVIDEAYKDFTKSDESIINLVNTHNNLIIVHSMTKKYAIPGLRLGYIITNSASTKNLLKLKQPWTVNALAIEAGKYIVNQIDDKQFDIVQLLNESQHLQQKLQQIKCIDIISSSTPYFLIKFNKSAQDIQKYLIKNHGILVRDASNFRGLNNQYIRVSSRNESDNNLLINALTEWTQI